MAATLEDLDRRIAVLESARHSERVDAIERAIRARVIALEKAAETEKSAAGQCIVDALNERFDAVMAALDALKNP